MALQTRSSALQNELVRLYCRFIKDGLLTSPLNQPAIEILDTDGVTIIGSAMAVQEFTGVYYVDWFVPQNLPLGQYYDRWTFQWDAASSIEEITMLFEVHSMETYINFLSTGISYQATSRSVQLMADLANDFIYEAQHIPVYWEQGMRIQQENQRKRTKNYYYFVVSNAPVIAYEGDVYDVGGLRYTVFQDLALSTSSSSSSSSSSSTSSSTSSSLDSSSSTSSSNSSSTSSNSSSTSTVTISLSSVSSVSSESHSTESSISNSSSSTSSSSSSPYSVSSVSSLTSESSSSTTGDSLSSSSSSSLSSSSSSNWSTSSSSSSYSSSSTSSSSTSSSTTSSTSTMSGEDFSSQSGYVPTIVLTCTGSSSPPASGTLTLITGTGSSIITYSSYTTKTSRFSTIYNLAYKNWNTEPRPIVRLNNRIVDDGWHVDYDGRVYFDRLLTPEDSINVAYNFSYFSKEELMSFLQFGLKMMNSIPPASMSYAAISSAPTLWDPGILLMAAITALKRLIFGLNWQEKMIIFGTPEQAQNAQQKFQELYSSYNELWLEFGKNVKTKKLPGIAQVSVPEYTMPGGRCLSSDTYIKILVTQFNGTQHVMNTTIENAFQILKRNYGLKTLSMNNNRMSFETVSSIFKSGEKQTYILKTKNNEIRLTEEHLVYIPEKNRFEPTFDIKNNSKILVVNNNRLVVEKTISKPIKFKVEPVYDLEVPSTENFLGNNIVSHNSRWFRYLYKTGSGS